MRLIMLLFFLWTSLVPSMAYCWEGDVVQVLDGDSIRVKRGHTVVEVRLYGIDCPEWKQAYGNEAKQYTRTQLYRRAVSVVPLDRDRYGRVVALVTSSGQLVNRELVRQGFAWVYPKYCRLQPLCSELQQLETEARRERRGLWQDNNAISPWQWKRKYKYPAGR